MTDRYRSFEELAEFERESIDYQVRVHRRPSALAILAPHGGKIEPGTSELAECIAGEDFSYYAFEGIRSGRNSRLRLSSLLFDEPECVTLLAECKLAVTVDGLEARGREVKLGGANAMLRHRLFEMLGAAGFEVLEDDQPPAPDHLCNRISPGVDVEVGSKLRDWFESHPREMDRFVSCVRSVLLQEALNRSLKFAGKARPAV